MLSKRAIEQKILDKKLRIFYSFLKTEAGTIRYFPEGMEVKLGHISTLADMFFHSSITLFRWHLTAGPLYRSMNKTITSRYNSEIARSKFRDDPDFYDARNNIRNEFTIFPNETLQIFTNEWVMFPPDLGCIVVPTVRNNDKGLILSTAYIDPNFKGILRVVVRNVSDEQQVMKVLQPLAQCIFFQLDELADTFINLADYSKSLNHKSGFYGLTWNRIIDSEEHLSDILGLPNWYQKR